MSNTAHDTTKERPEAQSGPEWGSPEELSEFSDEIIPTEPSDEPGPCDLAR